MLPALWTALTFSLAAGALPSVVVMNLEPKMGVNRDVADLLTSNVVATLKSRRLFSRVVSAREIESLIGLEKQRQMLSCDTGGCMAEIAGAMGADFVLVGSVGRLGETWLFNAALVNANRAQADATVSRPITGSTEEALLEAIPGVLDELLGAAHLVKSTAAAAPGTPTPREAASAPPSRAGRGALGKALVGAGAVTVGGGLFTVLGAAAAAGASTALGVVWTLDSGLTEGKGLGVPLGVALYAGYVLGALGLMLALGGGVLGTALLGIGVIVN